MNKNLESLIPLLNKNLKININLKQIKTQKH